MSAEGEATQARTGERKTTKKQGHPPPLESFGLLLWPQTECSIHRMKSCFACWFSFLFRAPLFMQTKENNPQMKSQRPTADTKIGRWRKGSEGARLNHRVGNRSTFKTAVCESWMSHFSGSWVTILHLRQCVGWLTAAAASLLTATKRADSMSLLCNNCSYWFIINEKSTALFLRSTKWPNHSLEWRELIKMFPP